MNRDFRIKEKIKEFFNGDFFAMLLGSSWFLALAVKKWMSGSLFLMFGISLWILIKDKNQISLLQKNQSKNWLLGLTITLAFPLIAVLLGQLLRQEFHAPSYDSSLRFLLAIPILYVILHHKINTFKYLEYAIPFALFASLISLLIKPNQNFLVHDRFSSYFVDPILFGSICLTLALMSLISINLHKNDSWCFKAYKVIGFLVGIYLSIRTGSRTGWLAIPIVLLLWSYVKFNKHHFLISITLLTCFIVFLFFIPIVQQRITLAVNEISSYQWNSLNPDTSVGIRISLIRMGLFLFSHNLFSGFGDSGFKELINEPELSRFASDYARNLAITAGFHNEIISNMVRSGIWGLISSLLIFITPFCLFIKGLCSTITVVKNYSLIAISYLICVFISGITIEVFSSKLTTSFHAILMVNLIGSILVMMSSNQQTKAL